jgi:hypothetical protein
MVMVPGCFGQILGEHYVIAFRLRDQAAPSFHSGANSNTISWRGSSLDRGASRRLYFILKILWTRLFIVFFELLS